MSNQPQGQLNRLRATVVFDNVPELNLTADFLGSEGVRLSFENNATDLLPTMSGMVSSPRPYQECTLTASVVKSMPVGNLYKNAFEANTLVGSIKVFPDVATGRDIQGHTSTQITPFQLENCALENIREMSFAGNEPTLVVTIRGYYQVNQGFFSVNGPSPGAGAF